MQKIGRAAAAALATAVIGACGTSGAGSGASPTITHQSADQAVFTSFDDLGAQTSLTMALSIGATPQQLQQLDAASGTSKKNRLTSGEARGLSSTKLSISVASTNGTPLSKAAGASTGSFDEDIALGVNGDTPVDLRVVDGSLYVQAQVAKLLTDYGQDPAKADHFTSQLRQADAQVPGLGALGKGNWVTVSKADLQGLTKALQAALPAAATTTTVAGHATQLVTGVTGALRSALKAHATFANLGNHDGRTEYSVTVPVQAFAADFEGQLATALAGTPYAEGLRAAKTDTAKVPASRTVVLDVFVSGSKASEVDLDLSQFDPKITSPLPLKLALSNASGVSAPSGATPLDLSKIAPALGAFAGKLGGLGASASTSTESTSSTTP